MAIANVSTGAASFNTAATITPAFGATTGAGHLLIALVTGQNNGAAGIATTSAGWNTVNQGFESAGDMAIFSKTPSASGETAPTFTCASATYMGAVLMEFSGAGYEPYDQLGTASPWSSGGAVTAFHADASATNLVVFVTTWNNSKTATVTFGSNSFNNGAGASTTVLDDSATKQIQHSWGFWAINTTGGTTGDSVSPTYTMSTGTPSTAIAMFASFTIASKVPARPQQWRNTTPIMRAAHWMRDATGLLAPERARERIVIPRLVV